MIRATGWTWQQIHDAPSTWLALMSDWAQADFEYELLARLKERHGS